MALDKAEINYSPVSAIEEQEEINSHRTVKKQPLYQESCSSAVLSRSRIKIISATLVLVTIAAGSIVFAISSHRSEAANIPIGYEPAYTTVLNDLPEETSVQEVDSLSDHRLPQLRSYREHSRHQSRYTLGHMNIYIRNEDRQSFQRLRIPVARYARHRIPLRGPFLNYMPWTSIFADRSSKQTIIYAQRAVYVIPPLINTDDQLFSLAQLIATGHASLVRNGLPPNRDIGMLQYFYPRPLIGPGIPRIDSWSGSFTGGIHGNFGPFSNEDYDTLLNIDDSREREEHDHYKEEERKVNYYETRNKPHEDVKKPHKPKKPKKQTKSARTRTSTSSTSTTVTSTIPPSSTDAIKTTTNPPSTTDAIKTTTNPPSSTNAITTTTIITLSTSTPGASLTDTSSASSSVTASTSTNPTPSPSPPPNCEGDEEPRTPFILIPFQNNFTNPSILPPLSKECRSDGHCIFSYTIDVFDTRLAPFDQVIRECASKPRTIFMTYNGQVPGPTFVHPAGHESVVRFNNRIENYFQENLSPCTGDRKGRPISVHHHGSASAPPFDGWAEDETCLNETKEYVYPNNRPATDWYHDHALHITADNAYHGLAGLYIVSSKKQHGGCGEPWNLEDIEDIYLILQDKAIDSNCQLSIDAREVDEENFYGDINLVSGIPFPLMHLEPKWYRFRYLNAAISRPFKVKIKDASFKDISQQICKVIATDAGFRRQPVTFPVDGLLIGVGERYEIVCDFTAFRDQTLYMWNDEDEDFMKDVPYFCYSHFLAKLQILSTVLGSSPAFNESLTTPEPERPIERVLTDEDLATATRMAENEESHRRMDFERSGGQWVINGKTWDTEKIAADDIGQNTWEVWELRTGGGWFHPVHIHLADFYILIRDRDGGLKEYEKMSPKDIIYLGPSQNIWALIRFGPHKGDYMFHCHNLIHEDDDMMRAFRIIDSQDGANAPSAEPFIHNNFSNITYSNWKYTDPMLTEVAPKPTSSMPELNAAYMQNMLKINIYRIFYPTPDDALLGGFNNPWKSAWCSA